MRASVLLLAPQQSRAAAAAAAVTATATVRAGGAVAVAVAAVRRCSQTRAQQRRASSTASAASSSPKGGEDSSKIYAPPFRLASADALRTARSLATVAAHWDERGTLEGFAAYSLLTRFDLAAFFGAKYEEIVTHEQSAAVYVPTWIVDAAVSFEATATGAAADAAETTAARTTLLLEHARFPGSAWAPVSSLPIWPANVPTNIDSSASQEDADRPQSPTELFRSLIDNQGSASSSTASTTDPPVPDYEPWQPELHLTAGSSSSGTADSGSQAQQQQQQQVKIDGPINALPFELSPLALPSFLRSLAEHNQDAIEDKLVISTRQPSTAAEVVLILRKDRQEFASLAEAENIAGIELSTPAKGWLQNVINAVSTLLNQNSSDRSPAEVRAERQKAKREKEEREANKERRVRLRPETMQVDMLAAYPVMLPMHLIKFSYQPTRLPGGGTAPKSNLPARKTLTIALAGWDDTAKQALRTLPSSCNWSRWGHPLDVIPGYGTSPGSSPFPSLAAQNGRTPTAEPPTALRFSPLNIARFEMVPSPPVKVPASNEGIEEALGEQYEAFFGPSPTSAAGEGNVGGATAAATAHAEMLLAMDGSARSGGGADSGAIHPFSSLFGQQEQQHQPLSAQSSTSEDGGEETEGQRRQRRDDLAHHLLRHAYKAHTTQLLQQSLARRASESLNAAEQDAEDGAEIGGAQFRAWQNRVLRRGASTGASSVPGVHLAPTASTPHEAAAAAAGSGDPHDDEADPALPDPSLLAAPHVQPFPHASRVNRRYLAALGERTRAAVMDALADSGDAVVFTPAGAVQVDGQEDGATRPEDLLGRMGPLKMVQGTDARKATARQAELLEKLVQEMKPEWLRRIHDAERARELQRGGVRKKTGGSAVS